MENIQQPKFKKWLWIFVIVVALGVTVFAVTSEQCEQRALQFWREVTADAYMKRVNKSWHEYGSDSSTNAQDNLFEAGRELQKDYPARVNGYQLMMCAIEDCTDKNPAKARALANELSDSSAPEYFKLWSKGFLHRPDSRGRPVTIKFAAVDGREVDTAQMLGKVVLVGFWAITCAPCVAELPRIKAGYEKYHQKGFEVIGISCDTDRKTLEGFIKNKEISWPQYFDGKQQEENKFAQGFGIDGIPHLFLVDKKGCLRFDDVRPFGDKTNFEEKIESLLAE